MSGRHLHIIRRWEIEENRKIWREIEEGGEWDNAYVPYADEETRFTGQSITGTAPDSITIGMLTIFHKVEELSEKDEEDGEEVSERESEDADGYAAARELRRQERERAERRADLKKRYKAARQRYENRERDAVMYELQSDLEEINEAERKKRASMAKIEKLGRWKWKIIDGKERLVPINDPD
jgi:hypothetical protein